MELSYHVPGASWRPLYDLTLDGEQLAVSYLAEVTQRPERTGPRWSWSWPPRGRPVSATCPSWIPGTSGRSLRPLLSARDAADDPPGHGLHGRSPAAAAAQADRPEAAVLMAEPGDAVGAGLVYRVQRPLAVPADGGPHKTSISRFGLDAALDHLAVPALAPEAYLRATVTNTSPLLLLPGPARVFHGPQFAGETSLPTVAAGEEFELQLGVDDQIRVERTLRRRSTGKAVIGGTRTIDVGYEINVENHRTGKTKVSVHDRIPVSTDAEIRVRLREANPAPASRPTWASSPGSWRSTAARRRRQVPVHRRASGPGHGERALTRK